MRKSMLLIAALFAPQIVSAQDSKQLLAALDGCRSVKSDDARLKCYDDAAARLAGAQTRNEVVVLDRAQVEKAKRSLFGFSQPSAKVFGEKDEPLREISSTIATVRGQRSGLVRLTLADGSTWESIDTPLFPPKTDDTVTIKAGVLGSYTATPQHGRALRVHRVN